MNFPDRLTEAVRKKNNPTVAGLDPMLDYLPDCLTAPVTAEMGKTFEAAGECLRRFNMALIDALCDVVAAVKPQAAYYEQYGLPGLAALKDTIDYAKKKGLPVIADGKRNDIGSTATAYAGAWLGETDLFGQNSPVFDADALTVNPYLGSDGLKPFAEQCDSRGKGIFVLVKTSNPSSGEMQDLSLGGGGTVYGAAAKIVRDLTPGRVGKSGYSSIGIVAGATYPKTIAELREILPNSIFLVPGYGAQGGGAAEVVPAFDSNGGGAIVNSSRAIMCAWKSPKYSQKHPPEDFAGAARAEAIAMRDAINRALQRGRTEPLT